MEPYSTHSRVDINVCESGTLKNFGESFCVVFRFAVDFYRPPFIQSIFFLWKMGLDSLVNMDFNFFKDFIISCDKKFFGYWTKCDRLKKNSFLTLEPYAKLYQKHWRCLKQRPYFFQIGMWSDLPLTVLCEIDIVDRLVTCCHLIINFQKLYCFKRKKLYTHSTNFYSSVVA